MGCDIHFVIEKKTPEGWLGIMGDNNFSQRWYEAFGRLAGVREDGPEPNGLPNDMSLLAKDEVANWEGDGHSHSHLSLMEFIQRWYGEKFPKEETDLKCSELFGFYPLDEYDVETEYRVIFFFDN